MDTRQALFLLGAVLQLASCQNCDKISVSVEAVDDDNYLNKSISLICTYSGLEAHQFMWRVEKVGASAPDDVYLAVIGDDSASGAEPDYVGKVNGTFIEPDRKQHFLTLIEAGKEFDKSSWSCEITSFTECPGGVRSEGLSITLKEPTFHALKLLIDEDEIDAENPKADSGASIQCSALSDPQSTVSISGTALRNDRSTSCIKTSDDIWDCSVKDTAKKTGSVFCAARFFDEEYVTEIKDLHVVEGGFPWWAILLITITLIIGIVGPSVAIWKKKCRKNNVH